VGTNEGLPVHTDWNFWKRSEAYPELQGGICLADCPEGGGGFFCVPGNVWIAVLPPRAAAQRLPA
jgi:hypothetical protein